MIIASKQVNNYDLSDAGRSTWTPDPAQPGYGNFCYGVVSKWKCPLLRTNEMSGFIS